MEFLHLFIFIFTHFPMNSSNKLKGQTCAVIYSIIDKSNLNLNNTLVHILLTTVCGRYIDVLQLHKTPHIFGRYRLEISIQ